MILVTANARGLRANENGWIVRVLDERITVYGTAWYQLEHSTINMSAKRSHACVWFGVCSYRKLKVTAEKHKDLCPICGEDLVRVHHCGSRFIAKDVDSPVYEHEFFDDLVGVDGLPNWVEAVGVCFGG